ncbi:MAG: OmpW family outer membrane protein [Pseudomonadota bacterium]
MLPLYIQNKIFICLAILVVLLPHYAFAVIKHDEHLPPRVLRLMLNGSFRDDSTVVFLDDIETEFSDDSEELDDNSTGITGEFSYHVYDNFAIDFGLSYYTSSEYEITVTDDLGSEIGEFDLIFMPVDLGVSYHFAPYGKITPYIGGGGTYAIFTSSDVDNTAGYYARAGLDYWGFNDIGLSFRVQQYFGLDTSSEITYSNVSAFGPVVLEQDLEINILTFSLGVAYRF